MASYYVLAVEAMLCYAIGDSSLHVAYVGDVAIRAQYSGFRRCEGLNIIVLFGQNVHAWDLLPHEVDPDLNKNVSPFGPEGPNFLFKPVSTPHGRRSCTCTISPKWRLFS